MQRHFTATAFIVDSNHRTLLMWHKRLQRWMPPGGHCDSNETPEETAIRECREETGMDVEIIGDPTTSALGGLRGASPQEDMFAENPSEGRMLKMPVAFLLEEIPASPERGEGAHQHMDFLYVARPKDETQALTLAEEEGVEMRWFAREDILKLDTSKEIFANVKHYILKIL